MSLQTTIVAFALAVATGGFGFWFWIDLAILPRKPNRYLRYSLIGGLAFGLACFAAFAALVVPQSGQKLLGMGLVLSFWVGLIAGIGMASPYWIIQKLGRKD